MPVETGAAGPAVTETIAAVEPVVEPVAEPTGVAEPAVEPVVEPVVEAEPEAPVWDWDAWTGEIAQAPEDVRPGLEALDRIYQGKMKDLDETLEVYRNLVDTLNQGGEIPPDFLAAKKRAEELEVELTKVREEWATEKTEGLTKYEVLQKERDDAKAAMEQYRSEIEAAAKAKAEAEFQEFWEANKDVMESEAARKVLVEVVESEALDGLLTLPQLKELVMLSSEDRAEVIRLITPKDNKAEASPQFALKYIKLKQPPSNPSFKLDLMASEGSSRPPAPKALAELSWDEAVNQVVRKNIK